MLPAEVIMIDLPGAIRDGRIASRMSQAELGAKFDVSESTISRWERGDPLALAALRARQIVALSTWLNLRPTDVLVAAAAAQPHTDRSSDRDNS